jgi:ribonuclease P protein component
MDFAREPRRALGVRSSSDVAPKAESASQQVFRRSKAVIAKSGRFQRADRILGTRDFVRVTKTGKRGTSKSFVVLIAPRTDRAAEKFDEKRRRLGVTVSKRVGNAVIRNRVKRRIREWFRHAREGLPDGSDIVVIARRTARDLSGLEVAALLDQMIPRVGVRGSGQTSVSSQ